MSRKKLSSSHAAWSLITEGVTAARLEVHRLRHMLDRALKLVEQSTEKEHLYQVGGDLISDFPRRLSYLERFLDRTSYALSLMGEEFLRGRLTIPDRAMVQDSIQSTELNVKHSAQRVLIRYLENQHGKTD